MAATARSSTSPAATGIVEDLPDHADKSTVENLITELKDALGLA